MPRRKGPGDLIKTGLAIEADPATHANGSLGYTLGAMCQVGLPHSKVEGYGYTRRNGDFTLTLLSPLDPGLPYGVVPRLVLAWMATEVKRTRWATLEMGDSLSGFLRQLDMVPTGGRWGSIGRVKDQVNRLLQTTIRATRTYTVVSEDGKVERSVVKGSGYSLAEQSEMQWWDPQQPDQPTLWKATVTLSQPFYKEILDCPVPVDMRALHALKKSPLALDLYCWLTHRQCSLRGPTVVQWKDLAAQFGGNYTAIYDFQAAVAAALKNVCLVYLEVKAKPTPAGLKIWPSPTSVPMLPRTRSSRAIAGR